VLALRKVDASRTCLFGPHSENARDALSGNCSSLRAAEPPATTIANSEGQIADQRIAGRVIANLPDLRGEAAPATPSLLSSRRYGQRPDTGSWTARLGFSRNEPQDRATYCNNVAVQGVDVESRVGAPARN
jgi:hypothetical protein